MIPHKFEHVWLLNKIMTTPDKSEKSIHHWAVFICSILTRSSLSKTSTARRPAIIVSMLKQIVMRVLSRTQKRRKNLHYRIHCSHTSTRYWINLASQMDTLSWFILCRTFQILIKLPNFFKHLPIPFIFYRWVSFFYENCLHVENW